ncbi:acyltransferase [Roseofilum sp. BLCC_M91]|uniref:Acyltransferase n=1 Tax=Roseofilum halophilum BLCC-M91 TaxID=3022259 RepID=A0ABT7BNG4_9CYAN|nr:acyltransferase [Roseofilum halophilum]MDJ1180729.1 acyltransferase [Roseofilum halophilum BLCC-M91]
MANQPNQTGQRINWIDQIKGLAIFGILLFHFFQNYPERIPLVVTLDQLGAKVGFAAVDIFFVMAGFNITYVMARKNLLPTIHFDWRSWLIKRLNRLYPTYLLAVIFSLVLYFLLSYPQKYIFPDFLLSVAGLAGYTFQSINPGFWFFTVILQAYLVTPLIFRISQSKPIILLIVTLFLGVVTKVLCFNTDTSSDLYWYLLQNDFLGSYIFQFGLGLYWGIIYFYHDGFRKIDYWWTLLVFLLGFIVYIYLGKSGFDFRYMLGFDMLFTPLFFVALQSMFVWLDKRKRIKPVVWLLSFLSLLGLYSYQIYLIHQPLFFVAFRQLNKYVSISTYPKILFLMLSIAMLLWGYTGLFVFCDRQLRKWIKG